MDIDRMFHSYEDEARRFRALLKSKGEPSDLKGKNKARWLELQVEELVRKSGNGHRFITALTLVYLRGFALGADFITAQELIELDNTT